MSKEQDKLNGTIDNLTQEWDILQSQLQATLSSFQQKEKELSERIQNLVKSKEELERKS